MYDLTAVEVQEIREGVFNDILQERFNQVDKWGDQTHNPRGLWLGILGEEFGEVAKATIEVVADDEYVYGIEKIREELIQLAAVAVAWLESIDGHGEQPHAIRKPLEELVRE